MKQLARDIEVAWYFWQTKQEGYEIINFWGVKMDYNKLSDILLYDYKLDFTSIQIFTLLDLINDYNMSVEKAILIYKRLSK